MTGNLGLPYLQIQKRHTLWGGGGGGGVSYFTSELFVCEGARLIKCDGGKMNGISNSQAPSFLFTTAEKSLTLYLTTVKV